MRFSIALSTIFLGLAAAQSSSVPLPTGTSSSCQAQNIVDACRSGIQAQVDKCGANDWVCLCDNYTNLLTCYNNCPDSNERPPVQNQVIQFCNAAAPIKSASSASAATVSHSSVATSTSATTSATGSAAVSNASGFGSGTASATGAQNTGAAGSLAIPAGGAMAVLLGVAGLL